MGTPLVLIKMADSPFSAAEIPPLIFIKDDFEPIPVSLVSIPTRYQGMVESVCIPHGLVRDRVQKIAQDVFTKYQGQELHMVCILKGAYQFYNDLQDLAGKKVLLVEDIIDSGLAMAALTQEIQAQAEPTSIEVVSLLLKRTERSNGFLPHYAGFSIPDKFIVGYALDLNENFRDLDHICIISEAGIAKFA